MNGKKLLEEIRETEAILQRLKESLEEARNNTDPFGVFVFQERKAYRRQSNFDRSKSGKRTKEWTEQSYIKATHQGFRGDYHAWVHVLHATPKVEPRE